MNTNSSATQYRIAYRFKQNRAIAKKQVGNALWGVMIYLAMILAYIVFLSNKPESVLDQLLDHTFVLLILALSLFIPVGALFFSCKRQIEINQQAIIFQGSFTPKVPKSVSWDEIAHIYKVDNHTQSQKKWWNRITRPLTLIFILTSGKEFTLVINNNEDDLFISDGHPLNIIAALELYRGTISSVESISEAARKQIKFFYVGGVNNLNNIDLGKEVGNVAYSAVILALISITLLFALPIYALESTTLAPIFWSVAIGTTLMACWHMRHIDNKMIMIIPAMLFSGMMVLLMIPVTGNLPVVFGHQSTEIFVISDESDTRQIWHSELAPTLTLRLDHKTARRRFHGIGTQREFTVFRGPFGLNSIPKNEYKSLRHND